MRTQIGMLEALGRTLEAIVTEGDHVLLVMSGGYLVCLGVNYGYEHGDEEIEEQDFDPLDWNQRPLVNARVLTDQEYRDALEAKRGADTQDEEQRARMQYEALKARFEG